MNWLSKAGRTTLAKSVHNIILMYTMQNLWVSNGVYEEIDIIMRTFI